MRRGEARNGYNKMPKKRPPKEVWCESIRPAVYKRDRGRCQGPYCKDKGDWSVSLETCHIDHVRSGKFGTNAMSNLRVLCRRCHVLRADMRHRGMVSRALEDGIIPPDWRKLVWDD